MFEEYWFGSYAPGRMLVDLNFLHIYWYSVCVTAGIAIAAALARRQYMRRGGSEKVIIDFLFYAVIGGILGARLWHVFVFQWSYYAQHLNEIVRIWEGGIAIQGALLGGFLAAVFYARVKRVDLFMLIDSSVVGIPLAQAIGRWGNFFNQELYGLPTKMPWGIYIEPQNRVVGYEVFSHFHPTFLYESMLNAVFFYILLRYSKKQSARGSITAVYFIGYGFIRFMVDFVRIDPMPTIGFLRSSQVISLVFILMAFLYLVLSRRSRVAK